MMAVEALERFVADVGAAASRAGSYVLDVGSGAGDHAAYMRRLGMNVRTLDPYHPADIRSHYPLPYAAGTRYVGIWCSHVLEHQRDVGRFLTALNHDLSDGGLLAVTVPPMRTKLVGGHLNQFTEGSLVYNLILAGFDCRRARVGVYGYNVSVLVRKDASFMPPTLVYDSPDINVLAKHFPWPVNQGIDGRLGSVGW